MALDVAGGVVLVLFAIGWTWSIANARSRGRAAGGATPATAAIASALTSSNAPSVAYLGDAALTAFAERLARSHAGASGRLRATIQSTPSPLPADSAPNGARIRYQNGGAPQEAPAPGGVWNVVVAVGNALKPLGDFHVITMLPFSAKKNGHVGLYFVGSWPGERGASGPSKAPAGAYANPAGFIEVTARNKDTHVSDHFKLGDFLTHDQPNVWPKYMVLQTKLIDKLELVLADLEAHGVNTKGVRVMSGFRTPQYNVGGGNTGGRASNSRHMFGDASDIYIDDDGDGQMDDLNHDGKISIADSRVILEAVERVEGAHPELIGGAGVYTAAPGHGPFIHIDTRGYRARWTGTSGG